MIYTILRCRVTLIYRSYTRRTFYGISSSNSFRFRLLINHPFLSLRLSLSPVRGPSSVGWIMEGSGSSPTSSTISPPLTNCPPPPLVFVYTYLYIFVRENNLLVFCIFIFPAATASRAPRGTQCCPPRS